jgi:DNA-binding MarR family transcriptional regulator
MKNERLIPKSLPKGEVLRKVAQRYPDLPIDAMEIFLSIKRVVQQSDCDNQEALERFGLSEGKFFVLADLFSEDLLGHDAPSPSEIAEQLGVTRATITGLLDGLERDGYLERCPDHRDRRALTVHMTDKARQFLDEYIPWAFRRISAQMADLTEPERQTLIELIAKIGPLP